MPDRPKYHLCDVRGELRAKVLDLCVHRLWHDARDLLHQHGFFEYTIDDLINFYNWAPTNIEELPPPPQPPVGVQASACPAAAHSAPLPLTEPPASTATNSEPAPDPQPASAAAQEQAMPDIPEIPPASSAPGPPSQTAGADLQSGSGVPAAVPPEPETHDDPTPLPPPEAPAENPALARKRRGKVARLPKDIRDELNLRLENGESYETIIRWLARQGHRGFKSQNLTNWKEGGYQDWRRENERIENLAMQREWLSEQIAKTQPGELFALIDQLFVSQLMDSLFGLDTAQMKQGLAGNPRHFIALFNAFNRYKRQAMDTPEFQEFLRRQKERKNRKRGISPETLREIEEILGIRQPILGVKSNPEPQPPPSGGVKANQG